MPQQKVNPAQRAWATRRKIDQRKSAAAVKANKTRQAAK